MKKANKGGWASGSRKLVGMVMVALMGVTAASAQSVASATTEAPSISKSLFGRADWASIQREYASPREICRMVEKHVRYTTEKEDNWSPAEETWARGRGDCEDFAILIQNLCQASGMSTKVHLYFPAGKGREGHAVLVGEWNGKMWFSSNGSYEEVKSEDEVRRRVSRMLSCKEKALWGMKLNEREVARYIEKSPARSVAMAGR